LGTQDSGRRQTILSTLGTQDSGRRQTILSTLGTQDSGRRQTIQKTQRITLKWWTTRPHQKPGVNPVPASYKTSTALPI
jgi:hypothetical protein